MEGLFLVLRMLAKNSLMTNSTLSQNLLELSSFNTSGGSNNFNEEIL